MDGTGPQHPLSDSQLDRELESALGIEPSPEFLARVRTRIAAEPELSLWRQAVWGRGVQPLAVVAIVGVVLAVVVPRWFRNDEGPSQRVATVLVPRETSRSVGRPPEDPIDVVPVRAVRRVAPNSEVPLRLSQPLFSEEERIAFVTFVTAVDEGWMPVQAPSPQATDQAADEPGPRIEPLVIDPLPQLTARARTEGETKW